MEPRTQAEGERNNQLVRLDHATLVKHAKDRDMILDLSMLPVETKLSLCTAKLDVDHFVVDDTGYDIGQVFDVRKHDLTLREAKYMNVSPKDPTEVLTFRKEAGIQFKLPSINKGRKREITVLLDGVSAVYLSTHLNNSISGIPGRTAYGKYMSINSMHEDYDKNRGAYAFVAQHTITFPKGMKDRVKASFLGLPYGTKFATKNGGEFMVERRINVDVNAVTHVSSGNLLVKPMNHAAMAAAAKNGWAHHMEQNGTSYFIASPNLYSDIAKYDVDVSTIELPFKSPFDTAHYGLTNNHMVGIRGVNTAVKQQAGMIFHTDQDKLVADLDDFLFGT